MIDFAMTASGDFIIGPHGDLSFVTGDEAIAQQVLFRLKTTKGDWQLSPLVGADLEQFIGKANTEVTRAAIEATVVNALTYDNLLFSPEVSCLKISDTEVLILVEFRSIENRGRIIQVAAGLDLRKGLVFDRVNIV